jgi:hypothetical protein
MSKKKELTEAEFKEMQEKMLTCGDTIYDAVNGLKLATKKMYDTTEEIEARQNDAVNRDNSELVGGQKKATDKINNILDGYINKFLIFKNNVEQKLSTLKLLREYEDNVDILEKHFTDNILEDGEYINKIKSQREINNRLAKYYENKNENLNYYTKYTKYIYFFAVSLLTCIVVYISYKRGVFNYILNITNVKRFTQNRTQIGGGGTGDNRFIDEIEQNEKKITGFCRTFSFNKGDRVNIRKNLISRVNTIGLMVSHDIAEYTTDDRIKNELIDIILKNISDQSYIRCRDGKNIQGGSTLLKNQRQEVLISKFYDDNELLFDNMDKIKIDQFSKIYKRILYAIISEGKEKYPIFPIHKDDIHFMGYDKKEHETYVQNTIDLFKKHAGEKAKTDEFYKYGKTSIKNPTTSSTNQRSSNGYPSSTNQRSSNGYPSSTNQRPSNGSKQRELTPDQLRINKGVVEINNNNNKINKEIRVLDDKSRRGGFLTTKETAFLKQLTENKEKNNVKLAKLKKSLDKINIVVEKTANANKTTSMETINNPKKLALLIAILIIIPFLLKPVIFPLFNLIKHYFIPAPV